MTELYLKHKAMLIDDQTGCLDRSARGPLGFTDTEGGLILAQRPFKSVPQSSSRRVTYHGSGEDIYV